MQESKHHVLSGSSPEFRDKILEKHITPVTLKPRVKQNPLYTDIQTVNVEENQRSKPSWTIEEFDRHSMHENLAEYLQVLFNSVR